MLLMYHIKIWYSCKFHLFVQVTQVVAASLGVPTDFVIVKPNNTVISTNGGNNGGSRSTELVCKVSDRHRCGILKDSYVFSLKNLSQSFEINQELSSSSC